MLRAIKGASTEHPDSEALIGEGVADILLAHGLFATVGIVDNPPKNKDLNKKHILPCLIRVSSKSGRFCALTKNPCLATEENIRESILQVIPQALSEVNADNRNNVEIIIHIDSDKISTHQNLASYVNRRLVGMMGLMLALGSISFDNSTKLLKTKVCLLSIPKLLKISEAVSNDFPLMVENYAKTLVLTIKSIDNNFESLSTQEIKDELNSEKPYHQWNKVVLHSLLAVLLEHISYVKLIAINQEG